MFSGMLLVAATVAASQMLLSAHYGRSQARYCRASKRTSL